MKVLRVWRGRAVCEGAGRIGRDGEENKASRRGGWKVVGIVQE